MIFAQINFKTPAFQNQQLLRRLTEIIIDQLSGQRNRNIPHSQNQQYSAISQLLANFTPWLNYLMPTLH